MLHTRNKVGFGLTSSSFREAYGNDGARGRSSLSKSPARPSFSRNAFNPYEDRSRSIGLQKTEGWDVDRRGGDLHSVHKYEYPPYTQTLEELELEYKKEAMELGRIRDKEEDEENYNHRETIREMRETYMKNLAILRGMHAKQWEEFLQLDIQKREQAQARQQLSASAFSGYNLPGYMDNDHTAGNAHYARPMPADTRGSYPYPVDNYSTSRAHDNYGEFQRQRREDYGKSYNRF